MVRKLRQSSFRQYLLGCAVFRVACTSARLIHCIADFGRPGLGIRMSNVKVLPSYHENLRQAHASLWKVSYFWIYFVWLFLADEVAVCESQHRESSATERGRHPTGRVCGACLLKALPCLLPWLCAWRRLHHAHQHVRSHEYQNQVKQRLLLVYLLTCILHAGNLLLIAGHVVGLVGHDLRTRRSSAFYPHSFSRFPILGKVLAGRINPYAICYITPIVCMQVSELNKAILISEVSLFSGSSLLWSTM